MKQEIELFTFGKGLERVWTALFKPLTFLSNKRRISYQEKCLILSMSDKKSQLPLTSTKRRANPREKNRFF